MVNLNSQKVIKETTQKTMLGCVKPTKRNSWSCDWLIVLLKRNLNREVNNDKNILRVIQQVFFLNKSDVKKKN